MKKNEKKVAFTKANAEKVAEGFLIHEITVDEFTKFCEYYKDDLCDGKTEFSKTFWREISEARNLTSKFVNEFLDNLAIGKIMQAGYNAQNIYTHLPKTMVNRAMDEYCLISISRNRNISLSFIEQHRNKMYWDDISLVHDMTPRFVERMKNYIDWDHMNLNERNSVTSMMRDEAFMMKYVDKIVWRHYRPMDIDIEDDGFINIHSRELYKSIEKATDLDTIMYLLAKGMILDRTAVDEYADKVSWATVIKEMDEYKIARIAAKYEDNAEFAGYVDNVTSKYFTETDWNGLSYQFYLLSETFIDKNLENFNWDNAAKYMHMMPQDLRTKYLQRLTHENKNAAKHGKHAYKTGREVIDGLFGTKS